VRVADIPGSIYEQSDASLWWRTTMIANWMRANIFRLARDDVAAAQAAFEARARDAVATGAYDNDGLAAAALDTSTRLFRKLVTKYRDGYELVVAGDPARLTNPDVKRHFYPNAWLKAVGYYDAPDPHNFYTTSASGGGAREPAALLRGASAPTALLLHQRVTTAEGSGGDHAWLLGGPGHVAVAATLALATALGVGVAIGRALDQR